MADKRSVEEIVDKFVDALAVRNPDCTHPHAEMDEWYMCGKCFTGWVAQALRTYGEQIRRETIEECALIGTQDWIQDSPYPANQELSRGINHMAGWQGANMEYRTRILALLVGGESTKEEK